MDKEIAREREHSSTEQEQREQRRLAEALASDEEFVSTSGRIDDAAWDRTCEAMVVRAQVEPKRAKWRLSVTERKEMCLRLVKDTLEPFKDIASKAGYSNGRSFAVAFTYAHGISPKQYRTKYGHK